MPSFKPKASKKIEIDNRSNITLDNKHNEFVSKFEENEKYLIPKMEKEKEELICKYSKSQVLEDKLDIKDKIAYLKKEIKRLKNEKTKYYLNNSIHIFNYFEEKKTISEGNNKTKVLYDFFNSSKVDDDTQINNNNVKQYLKNIDNNFVDINNYVYQSDICKYCKNGELIPVEYEGVLVCNNCSKQFKYLIENEKPSYKEPPKEVCFYAYKRINHFREILAQFQAKETTRIPDEVLENIRGQIKKERITLKQLTNKKAKDILKKLGYNKFYEHIPFIKDKLGIKPPVMTPELEDKLCNLFMEIQRPYAKYCPDDRVNFLNYYYTVYKLCELLGKVEFLEYFPMLKDREKRIEQDDIWKKICGELNWEFIPTI